MLSDLHRPMFRKYNAVRLFLMIADHYPKGVTQAELVGPNGEGSAIDPDRNNISRWARLFGEDRQVRDGAPKSRESLGLIEATPAMDQRTRLLKLATKGERLLHRIDSGETL